ncbi:hypothetical protein TNCV_4848051 [Trichonephila clavipes]|nr:hypothetical protein TNCV_4848051 [Trichonephila clavipes]
MKCVTNFLPLLFYSILISSHVKQSIAGKNLNKMKCTVYNAAINVFDFLCETRSPYTPRLPDSIARPIAIMPLSRMENTTFAMPSIIDSHDMGLRTVYSPDAQKKTPIQEHTQVLSSKEKKRS